MANEFNIRNGFISKSGSTVQSYLNVSGNTTSPAFITVDGLDNQFVKGDGTLDSTTYISGSASNQRLAYGSTTANQIEHNEAFSVQFGAIGANINSLLIKGGSGDNTRGGGIRFQSNNATLDGAFYWNTSILKIGSVSNNEVDMVVSNIPVATFTSAGMETQDEIYGASWIGNLEVPTKNAIYNKIQAFSATTDGKYLLNITDTLTGTLTVTTSIRNDEYRREDNKAMLLSWGLEGVILGNNGSTGIGAGEWYAQMSANASNSLEAVQVGAEEGLYIYSNTGSNVANWATRHTIIMNANTFTYGGNNIFHDAYHPNADTWTTPRILTIGNTGKSVDGSTPVTWTLAEIGLGYGTVSQIPFMNAGGTDFEYNANWTFDSSTGTLKTPTSFTMGHGVDGTVSSTYNLFTEANTTSTKTINIGTGTPSNGSFTINLGSSASTTGGIALNNTVTMSTVATQASENTSLMINGSGVVGTRELGSNAFNSTAFSTGTGTTNYVSKWTSTTAQGNSLIYDNGTNVGIGTPIPIHKLHVKGTAASGTEEVVKIEGGSQYNGLILNNTSNRQSSIIFSHNSTDKWTTGIDFAGDGTSNFYLYDKVSLKVPLFFKDDGEVRIGGTSGYLDTQAVTIEPGGNVGIGTTSPNAKLSISRASGFSSIKAINDGYMMIDSNGQQLRLNNYVADDVVIAMGGGNVGISTTAPSTKLHIKGFGTSGNTGLLTIDSGNTDGSAKIDFVDDGTIVGAINLFESSTLSLASQGDIAFVTNSVDTTGTNVKMTILGNGNVGIGTTTPSTKLDIRPDDLWSNCAINFTSNAQNPTIRLYRPTGSGTASYPFHIRVGGASSSNLEIASGGSAENGAETVTTKLAITNGGNVGIGTTSPDGKLHIDGVSASVTGLVLEVDGAVSNNRVIDIHNTGGAMRFGFEYDNNSIKLNIVDQNRDKLITFQGNGNIGINDSTPSYKLDVNGTGRFTDVLRSEKFIQITEAGTTLNEGKGIGYLVTDEFANVGNDSVTRYLNHYGWGIHKPLNATSGGRGTYMSGYFGMDFYTSGVNRMHINQGGNISIGNTNNTHKLDVSGEIHSSTYVSATDGIGIDSTSMSSGRGIALYGGPQLYPQYGLLFATTADLGTHGGVTGDFATYMTTNNTAGRGWIWKAGTINGTTQNIASINTIGAMTLSSTVTATNFILNSDERLKENIQDFDYGQHIKMDVKTYDLKSEKGVKRTGIIAQELEVNHPEFVRTDNEGMKSVAYIDLLMAKIAELEARLEKLE